MRRFGIAILLMAAAVCLIAIGAYRGEIACVLEKATHVCLECIGIG